MNNLYKVLGLSAAGVWLLLGLRTTLQVCLVTAISLLATEKRYKWLYIVYRTLTRDAWAAARFMKFNFILWNWERKHLTPAKIFSRELVPRYSNKAVFYFEDKTWTFAQVEEYSNKVANYFKSQGFKHGDTVALLMENCPEYVCIWLGLSKIGIISALINFNLRLGPLVHSIQVAYCKAILYAADFASAVREIVPSLDNQQLYEVGTSNTVIPEATDLSLDNEQLYEVGTSNTVIPEATDLSTALETSSSTLPQDIDFGSCRDKLLYIYTSGTTGLPKAAVVTNMRFMLMVLGVNVMLDVKEDDVIYDPLPLYHTAGGILGVGQAVLRGTPIALRKKFSASNFWTDCVKYNCTVAQYIGEICRYLLSVPKKPEHTQHQVRLMYGNGLRPQIWRQFVDRFEIKQIGEFYGSTEGNSHLINTDSTVGAVGFMPRYPLLSFLYPVGLVKVDEATGEPIRDNDGLCIKCKPGEPGVLVGKINSKKAIHSFHGYADKEASEKKILHDVFTRGDAAFNSGDILEMDDLGYFYFKDRTGDTFRWRGENVATSEVEGIISNVVGLKDCVVFGVEIPGVEGRAGMAAIVDQEKNLDMKALVGGMKATLPVYAKPLFVRVLNEVPITGTYKLKKRDLQMEGFDPSKIHDQLYFMDHTGQYVPLTQQLYADIISGKARL